MSDKAKIFDLNSGRELCDVKFVSLLEYQGKHPDRVKILHAERRGFSYAEIGNGVNSLQMQQGDVMPETVACLTDVTCFAESDIVFFDDKSVYCEYKNINRLKGIADCSDGVVLVQDDASAISLKIPETKVELSSGLFLSGIFSCNYFHFTCGILPKILLDGYVPEDVPLLVDANVRSFDSYERLLNICNRQKRDVIFLEREIAYKVEALYMITSPFFLAPNILKGVVDAPVNTQFDIETFRKYRDLILDSVDASEKFSKRIFLSRKHASSRRPFNEVECERLLRRYGFDSVCPEELSFEEQVNLFRNADVIVGGSGAAFTNILYCKPGCKIVILIGYEMELSYWQTIACMNDSSVYILSDNEKGKLTENNNPLDLHLPFYIAPNDVKSLISQWCEEDPECVKELEAELRNLSDVVTVGVLTYNSSSTVIETLESIKAQSYPRLSLQVCDDCSTDDTIDVCREWIENNRERFVEVVLYVQRPNLGVSYNCNRNFDLCKTVFLKEIAGDDTLRPDCIETCVKYAKQHPESEIVMGRMGFLGDNQERIGRMREWLDYTFFGLSSREQYERLILKGNCLPAAAAFYNVEMLRQRGLRNDVSVPAMEDWPKWVNFLRLGGRFGFIDRELVDYRVGMGVSTSEAANRGYILSQIIFAVKYRYPEVCKKGDPTLINSVIMEIAEMCVGMRQERRKDQADYWSAKNHKHLVLLRYVIIACVLLSVAVLSLLAYLLFCV